MVLGYKVEPACGEAEVVLPLAGGVEAGRSVAACSHLFLVLVCEVKERLGIVEALLGVLGVGLLEVEVVYRQSCRTFRNIIGGGEG